MCKASLGYFLLIISLLSCSAEKINLSPIENTIKSIEKDSRTYNYEERKNLIIYSSEITNIISSIPKFRNELVDSEVNRLKYHLKDYIGALETYNPKTLQAAQVNFEKSYKKLQQLRKLLKSDEEQVLNRYLVRIKTNMAFLESDLALQSTTTP